MWCDEHADFTAHKTVFCGLMCNNAATVFPVHRSGVSNVPIGSLRRYGVNNVCFTIVTGRYVTLDHIVPSTQAQKTSVYVKAHGCFYCFYLNVLRPLMSLDPMVFAICSSGTAPRVRVAFSSTPSRAGSFTARYMPWPHRRLGEAQR